jgi:glycosyltransferase involved in cell wall biosynthesis
MKVSVAMVTYNHEKYLAKALDSVLMQKTDFDFEIVIGEDCSTDNTRSILLDYKKRFPDVLQVILNDTNLGMYRNGAQVLQACRGEYIAMLDGDDYWTSPDKLQKQASFLDSHRDCSTCFHDAWIIHEDESREKTHYRPAQKEFSTVEDLLVENFIPTAAVMYRRGLWQKAPEWAETLKMGDWIIHILNAHHGRVGYIDETMAVYVIHRGGVWSTRAWEFHALSVIELFEALDRHLEPKYSRIIRRVLRWWNFALSKRYEKENNLTAARAHAVKSLARHLSILGEPLRFGSKGAAGSETSLPPYLMTATGARLLNSMLRLYVMPLLQTYIPTIYGYLKSLAGMLRINSWVYK